MIRAEDFVSECRLFGYNFFTGVPCSFLKPLINYVVQNDKLNYIAASNEGEAMGIAAGAYLGGQKAVVVCQNAGLGNIVNPITSLNHPFKIPALLVVTLRGEPGLKDEPQHELMGHITGTLLDTMGVEWSYFPDSESDIRTVLEKAENRMNETNLPYALIMKKGAVDAVELINATSDTGNNAVKMLQGGFSVVPSKRMTRFGAIDIIQKSASGNDAVVATTGKIGRELFTIRDKPNNIYIVGSMGLASSIGFGIKQVKPARNVIVLDGDGAAIMNMGVMATIGHYAPPRFIHIILDNEAYESTGGQETVSRSVDFCSVALACGYGGAYQVDTAEALESSLNACKNDEGPSLIHIKVLPGSAPDLGRPTIKPPQVKERFIRFLQA